MRVDPENSVFLDFHRTRDLTLTAAGSSGIEGIGRPRVEPSFIPDVIDRMLRVSTADSYAAMHCLASLIGKSYGASTGTDFFGALVLAREMLAAGESGSIVFLACDSGDRYLDTYYDKGWLASQGYDLEENIGSIRKICE